MIGSAEMFNDIEKELVSRLSQTDVILKQVSVLEAINRTSDAARTQRGLVFVTMYASLEYVVTNCVMRLLELISQEPKPISCFKDVVVCSILDSKFSCLRDAPKKRIWSSRHDLVKAFTTTDNISDVNSSAFPSGGAMNINAAVLENIWLYFDMNNSTLPNGITPIFVDEIKNHRNAIAHGRELASTIGKSVDYTIIKSKSDDIKKLCFHILSSFQDYAKDKNYLKPAAA